MANQFYETKRMFANYLGFSQNKQLSYDEWMFLPDSSKAAALFVSFFDQVTLAWNKAQADFVSEEDAIECVLQYLQKNVPIIKESKSRYTPSYVYRVSYNCIDCLRYIERDKYRSALESSNVVMVGDETLDLYDTVPDRIDFDTENLRDQFWRDIEELGEGTTSDKITKVINHLLNGESLSKVSKRAAFRESDPLKDVSVSKSEYQMILEILKEALGKYKEAFLGADDELVDASEADLVPLNLRKQPKLCDQVYAYIQAKGSITLADADRLFLLPRKPLNSLMNSLQDKGYPIYAHVVEVCDQVVPGKLIDMIDYYYIAE